MVAAIADEVEVMAVDHRKRSAHEGTATACQLLEQGRMIENASVDNEFGNPSGGDVDDARARARTTIAQALIGGAEGVRREKHVVQAEQWIRRIDRLLLEDVQAGSSNSAFAKRCRERGLIDDSAAGDIHKESGLLHQLEAPRVEQVMGLWSQCAHDDDEVRTAAKHIELDELRADRPCRGRVDIGVIGKPTHPEMLDESKEFLADVAETDCTDCAADKADAEEVRTLPPAAATGKLVEGTEVLAQAEEERQRRNRDRATNSVWCDGHEDSRPCARVEVDLLVADAESGQEREPFTTHYRACRDSRAANENGVESIDQLRTELVHIVAQKGPVDPA